MTGKEGALINNQDANHDLEATLILQEPPKIHPKKTKEITMNVDEPIEYKVYL